MTPARDRAPSPRSTRERDLPPAMEVRGVGKSFGHVAALHEASLRLRAGEVTALVGDNGAGKSTLLKILAGVHRPDQGTVAIDDGFVELNDPATARNLGIATVHQDLALVEVLDVATNLHLGDVPRRRLLVDRRRMEREAERVLEGLNARVASVRMPVGMLSGGQRQIIAISRAIRLGHSKVVLLDEPTAALGVQETARVGEIISELRNQGKAVLLVSHDLEFVFEYADRISVLRLGRTVGEVSASTASRDDVVALITGARKGSVT